MYELRYLADNTCICGNRKGLVVGMSLTTLPIYLITDKSHIVIQSQNLCLMLLLKTNNLIRSSFLVVETKLETIWYTRKLVPSHYSNLHSQYNSSLFQNALFCWYPKGFYVNWDVEIDSLKTINVPVSLGKKFPYPGICLLQF